MQVGTYIEKMFRSELSGNVIGMLLVCNCGEWQVRGWCVVETCCCRTFYCPSILFY